MVLKMTGHPLPALHNIYEAMSTLKWRGPIFSFRSLSDYSFGITNSGNNIKASHANFTHLLSYLSIARYLYFPNVHCLLATLVSKSSDYSSSVAPNSKLSSCNIPLPSFILFPSIKIPISLL